MAEELSVHELLVQVKHGNIDALGILYARYARKFYAYARSRGVTHEDAEDIVQNVFLDKIFEKIDRYNETRPGGATWLWQIFKNLMIDTIRLRPSILQIVSIDAVSEEDFASIDADPSLWMETYELYLARYLAWKHLSQADRDLLSQTKPGQRSKERLAAQARFKEAIEAWYNKNMQEHIKGKAQWTESR